eukprot:6787521-Prymnesium_polylepis.1
MLALSGGAAVTGHIGTDLHDARGAAQRTHRRVSPREDLCRQYDFVDRSSGLATAQDVSLSCDCECR